MSGDQHRDDELDFDDFILEDAPAGDLEDIFAASPKLAGKSNGPKAPGEAEDEEDLLFSDHAQDVQASEEFAGREQFAEVSPVRWPGHKMSVQDIGIPEQEEPSDPLTDLNDDLEIDSDQELEVVHDDRGLAAESFVLADGEETAANDDDWSLADPVGSEAEAIDQEEMVPEFIGAFDPEAEAGIDGDDSSAAAAPEQEAEYPVEEGWEPIGPDLGELDPAAEEQAEQATVAEQHEEELVAVGAGAEGDAELYYDETTPEVIGRQPRHNRLRGALRMLAAAVVVLGGGAVAVLRPEWIGLELRPQLVERVQLLRPDVGLRVTAPELPSVQVVQDDPPVGTTPVGPVAQQDPPGQDLPHGDPEPGDKTPPVAGDGTRPGDPVAVGPTRPADPLPSDPDGPRDPVFVPAPSQDPPLPNNLRLPVPVAAAPGTGAPLLARPDQQPKLIPAGETLWIGDFQGDAAGRQALEGVALGSKAFAQLQNGNFFVGSVKAVVDGKLILKLERGEVVLPLTEVVKVTAIDSTEYAELQKSTAGFLRLANNNRLAGSILASISDDAVVLQMRSDRIVVPKMAVARIVSEQEDAVRFAEGDDEEQWLREFATRQLRAMAAMRVAAPGGETRPRDPKAPAPKKK